MKPVKVVLFARIEDFSTLEEAVMVSNNFMEYIPTPDDLLYKVESDFYKTEPGDRPYFTIEATYSFGTFEEAFPLLQELNSLEMKTICDKFTLTVKNYP